MSTVIDEIVPESQAELAAWMQAAAGRPPRAIYPVGGRTALHYGSPRAQPGDVLCLSKLTEVVDYPARDMTVTVEAGIRMEDLARVLSRERQRLAVDVSESHRATLGGAVATNTSGPRRFGLGTLRDYVIGVSAVDALGRAYKAGGRVVKNVAGYDLCKMLIGSRGTLAVITQLTLKLKPIPEASQLLWIGFEDPDALEQALVRLQNSATRPVALEALGLMTAAWITHEIGLTLPPQRFVLVVGLEGTSREVAWQTARIREELQPLHPSFQEDLGPEQSALLWTALTDFPVPADEPVTFKANLVPSQTVPFLTAAENAGIAFQAHAGNGIVLGHLPDEITTVAAAQAVLEPLRSLARKGHGDLVVLHCDDTWKRDLQFAGDAVSASVLNARLKQQLDPRNVLNPE